MEGRAAKCGTHAICDCLLARLQAAERICELARLYPIPTHSHEFLEAYREWEVIRKQARLLSEIPEAQVDGDTQA